MDPGPYPTLAPASLEEGERDTPEERLQKQLLEKDQIQPRELEEKEERMKGKLPEISQRELVDGEEASRKETEGSSKRESASSEATEQEEVEEQAGELQLARKKEVLKWKIWRWRPQNPPFDPSSLAKHQNPMRRSTPRRMGQF